MAAVTSPQTRRPFVLLVSSIILGRTDDPVLHEQGRYEKRNGDGRPNDGYLPTSVHEDTRVTRLIRLTSRTPNIPDATENVQRKLGGGPAVPL